MRKKVSQSMAPIPRMVAFDFKYLIYVIEKKIHPI